ncbi:MAG TPA: DUF2953 domain-containing protein [Symbiobacteriaceae bacterium]|nr:DUF2953 domain-containing protein [Symbiobacteriaceae bacterium]
MLGVALALLAIMIIIHHLPVRTNLRLEQRRWDVVLHVHINAAWVFNIRRSLPISDKIAMMLEHMLKRWRATGEPVKIPLQKTIRRVPLDRIGRALGRPVKYFRRRLRVGRVDVYWEIGGSDAMQSALLAGYGWSLVGIILTQVSRLIALDPGVPRVRVAPVFAGPACRLDVDCIVHYRLGNIIVTGVWILFRVVRDGEVRAWARDSWRRKGVEGSGRASDSGPDEDGHGEP